MAALSYAPDIFTRLVAALPSNRVDEPTLEDRFSPRQVIAHLADWEPIFLDRIKLASTSPGSTITVFDEAVRAVEFEYANSNIQERLESFRENRIGLVQFVKGLDALQLANVVQHPEQGPVSTNDLIEMIVGHDVYHIEQLTAYLGEKTAATW
jgi:uncharacterized damage-inducible protein DinB